MKNITKSACSPTPNNWDVRRTKKYHFKGLDVDFLNPLKTARRTQKGVFETASKLRNFICFLDSLDIISLDLCRKFKNIQIKNQKKYNIKASDFYHLACFTPLLFLGRYQLKLTFFITSQKVVRTKALTVSINT